MNLPIVLEIAVGLIFIYLTLSLVASEIQEILSALFQWRAEHLKRSIEQLLAGDGPKAGRNTTYPGGNLSNGELSSDPNHNRQAAKTLADKLYESPLIENLNYEAQGRIAGVFRGLLHGIGAVYRTITFSRNVFGSQTSGPSYIPAETFATSLIDRLKLEDFQRLLVRSRFGEFVRNDVGIPLHNMVNELRARLDNEELLVAEMVYFDQNLSQILDDLDSRRITLENALSQVNSQLQAFEKMASEAPSLHVHADTVIVQSFISRLHYLRSATGVISDDTSSTTDNANIAILARIKPSLSDLTALLDPNSPTYAELVALSKREGGAVLQTLERLQNEVIPPRLRDSLATLGKRAETQLRSAQQATGNEIQQLQTEVENWFNNGMQRASGVYRRNVKGVGLLIGLAIAFTLNADTFYMYQRLSNDPAIRNSIIQTAQQINVQNFDSVQELSDELPVGELSEKIKKDLIKADLRSMGTAVEETLADYPLPIGRTSSVLKAQLDAEKNWPVPIIPQRFVGWSITALALSMGASFWFDLLRKITSVRASGNKPKE